MGKPHFANRKSLPCAMGCLLEHANRAAARGARQPLCFGKDLQLVIIYGAVILAFVEGRTPTIASIARYLQLPHETTRRYLKKIVDPLLLAKNGRGYKPTERTRKSVADAPRKIERLLRQAARELPPGKLLPASRG
jgi:hypothetical protein